MSEIVSLLAYEVLKEVSSCKYLYESTLHNALHMVVKHKTGFADITEEEIALALKKVRAALPRIGLLRTENLTLGE